MHDGPGLTWIQPFSSHPEQQCGTRCWRGQFRPSVTEPTLHGTLRRYTERDGALLVALAEYPQHTPTALDVVDVESAELAHPNSGGVQQLHYRAVAQCQ